MRKIGSYIAIIGLALILLPFIGLTIRFTDWIYNWGEGVAWAIKIGLVVVGVIMFFMGKPSQQQPASEEEAAE
ncbi:hypothetical protein [Winogradskyella sp.]|uniref:hypothetical protein n=1 Tax=Winogradskyella sp. TaxID=1883156 RepID=UPI00262F0D7E|nr:hypothetical protein [Winogradskyella sp.]